MLESLKVSEFAEQLSLDGPVPGGGSVAALCGALACGLVAMVGSLTVGREKYKEAWPEMEALIEEMKEERAFFLKAMDEDAASYAEVVECLKMPKETEEEKALRTASVQRATLYAAEVPLEVARRALCLFEKAEAVLARGSSNASSDAGVAAMMARTAVISALYNVRINAACIKDPEKRSELEGQADALEAAARCRESALLEKLHF